MGRIPDNSYQLDVDTDGLQSRHVDTSYIRGRLGADLPARRRGPVDVPIGELAAPPGPAAATKWSMDGHQGRDAESYRWQGGEPQNMYRGQFAAAMSLNHMLCNRRKFKALHRTAFRAAQRREAWGQR